MRERERVGSQKLDIERELVGESTTVEDVIESELAAGITPKNS